MVYRQKPGGRAARLASLDTTSKQTSDDTDRIHTVCIIFVAYVEYANLHIIMAMFIHDRALSAHDVRTLRLTTGIAQHRIIVCHPMRPICQSLIREEKLAVALAVALAMTCALASSDNAHSSIARAPKAATRSCVVSAAVL